MILENLIGKTPMIKIYYSYKGNKKCTYAKLEFYNFTGSIKDRIVYYILKNAKEKKELKEHQPIVEATSGNTGISLAAIGSLFQHPVHIFMPDWVSYERRKIMQLYGATIHLVSKDDGGFQKAIEKADLLAKEIDGYRPNQFCNNDNVLTHYETTGKEILNQIPNIDAFVSGIGTGGTLMGIAKRLKENNSHTKIYALEPDTLPILSQGKATGSHKIEGIGDDFVPVLVDRSFIDDVLLISDDDAINMSRLLSKRLGLGVGISSGANFLASCLIPEANIVTVFPDDHKKYLSTDLSKPINPNPNFISNQIELLSLENV